MSKRSKIENKKLDKMIVQVEKDYRQTVQASIEKHTQKAQTTEQKKILDGKCNKWSSRHYNAHLKEAHKADEWLDHGVDFFKLARAFEGRDDVATSKWLILKKYIVKQETQ